MIAVAAVAALVFFLSLAAAVISVVVLGLGLVLGAISLVAEVVLAITRGRKSA